MEQSITQTQYNILIENDNKRMKQNDEMKDQIDLDRKDLNRVRQDVAAIPPRLDTIDENIELLRKEVKELKELKETLPNVIKLAVDQSLTNISLNNPKKSFIVYYGLADVIKKLINKIRK